MNGIIFRGLGGQIPPSYLNKVFEKPRLLGGEVHWLSLAVFAFFRNRHAGSSSDSELREPSVLERSELEHSFRPYVCLDGCIFNNKPFNTMGSSLLNFPIGGGGGRELGPQDVLPVH